ncbi:MAG: HNH endonuclease, partial [Mucinivorans sp.]
NSYWEEVKRAIRMRDNYRCTVCGREGGYEVHHLTYYVNKQSIVGHELDHLECLTLLCRNCHAKAHNR